jgi:predicted RNA-binding Zn ribbon-like protein
LPVRQSKRGGGGGHAIVDFVNTVSWRLDPRRLRDQLSTFEVLLAWMERAGLLEPAQAKRLAAHAARDDKTAAHTLQAVRALRERLYRLLLEPADTSDQDLAALHHTFVGALSRASLEPILPLQWRPRVERPDDLPRLIALAAIELLRSPDVLRVRQCAGDGCGWLFLDHSRNQSRRWCSSSDCGNRHRVKNHYARKRRTGSSRS